ncbi:MAG: hypothetical protein TRG1_234 [Flavobacteriaceae bacterium FS1-H7996/R]|nr:MAG: hypothetical protein TRG1_234 [Flavobacteriaceae bacterium FS1-H7996/R]
METETPIKKKRYHMKWFVPFFKIKWLPIYLKKGIKNEL